jgi:hypothetical protein
VDGGRLATSRRTRVETLKVELCLCFAFFSQNMEVRPRHVMTNNAFKQSRMIKLESLILAQNERWRQA